MCVRVRVCVCVGICYKYIPLQEHTITQEHSTTPPSLNPPHSCIHTQSLRTRIFNSPSGSSDATTVSLKM